MAEPLSRDAAITNDRRKIGRLAPLLSDNAADFSGQFVICHAKPGHAFRLRFAHDMVPGFSFLLPRGVTVAQVTLDHFVMVRIHARQPFDALYACSWQAIRHPSHTEA